jgi:hypothetical protein
VKPRELACDGFLGRSPSHTVDLMLGLATLEAIARGRLGAILPDEAAAVLARLRELEARLPPGGPA